MRFIINGLTDTGVVRKINEDKLGFLETDHCLAAVVCDGMGGYKGGEFASNLSVETIINHFKSLSSEFDIEKEIIASFKKANDAIAKKASENQELSVMGTTSVLLLIKGSEFTTAHLGDSRVYLVRNNGIRQLTKDHSKLQQLIDENEISYDEALLYTDKNIITRALGINVLSKPEIADKSKVQVNDIFLLCTDGLTNYVRDEELLDLSTEFSPETACEQLVYLANMRGGEDNITILIVKVTDQ